MYSNLIFTVLFVATIGTSAGRPNNNNTAVFPSTNAIGPRELQDLASTLTTFLGMLPIKEQLVTALSEPVARAYDTLRPGLKAVGFAYLAYQAVVYLGMLGTWDNVSSNPRSSAGTTGDPVSSGSSGIDSAMGSKSLSEAIGELGVGAMAQSLQAFNFTPRSTEILNNWEQECKRRAFCELGKTIAERMPYFAWVVGYFGAKIPMVGQFADSFSQGIGRPDCSLLYPECPYLRPTT